MEINAYNKVNSSGSIAEDNKIVLNKNKSSLDMGDFLNLLVAQMTNQDSMNPMENTEFVSQLAQFSSLQAMSDLVKVSEQAQATSLIGKTVIVAKYNDTGKLDIIEGEVEKVSIHSGETSIFVKGVAYGLSNLMEIKSNNKDIKKESNTELDGSQVLEK